MSVLIKGMKMPTNCCQCPVNMEVCKRGYKYLLKHPELYDKIADDCPLVPVPPHGELIDRREAIIDANERAYDFWLSDDEVNATIQFLKEQPTIIPAKEGET